jgi:arginase
MDIQLLLVPYDSGYRGWRCGAGPAHLLEAGLVNHLRAEGHRVADVQIIEDDPAQPPAEIRTAFELMRRLSGAVRASREAGRFPIVLSGNCNAAVGVLSGLSPAERSVFWFDAHGESNTPDTTGSGFLDGMGLSTAFGWCWRALAATVPGFRAIAPDATYLLGARDLDPLETTLLAESGVCRVPARSVATHLPELLASRRFDGGVGYLHLDPDVLDPETVGVANTHPVPGGLTVVQLREAIRAIRARSELAAFTIASYAPEFDRDQAVRQAAFAAIDAVLV